MWAKFELATSISFKLCATSANPMLVAEARQEKEVREAGSGLLC